MKYFPIFHELFTSDSVIFLLIGLVAAMMIGVKITSIRKKRIAFIGSFLLYAVCEAVSNVHTSYLAEIILLIVGTASIGGMIGFLVGLAVAGIRNKNESEKDNIKR